LFCELFNNTWHCIRVKRKGKYHLLGFRKHFHMVVYFFLYAPGKQSLRYAK
jgi:hypothetical protein